MSEHSLKKYSQKNIIREHLEKIGHITPLEALRHYGCFRLAAVIFKLREEGMPILTKEAEGKDKKYAKYILQEERYSQAEFQIV